MRNAFAGIGLLFVCFLVGVGAVDALINIFGPIPAMEAPFKDTRVRYPNEEALAKKACADQKLMYWWIADPRKASATMTVRCTGQITKTVEVKF